MTKGGKKRKTGECGLKERERQTDKDFPFNVARNSIQISSQTVEPKYLRHPVLSPRPISMKIVRVYSLELQPGSNKQSGHNNEWFTTLTHNACTKNKIIIYYIFNF